MKIDTAQFKKYEVTGEERQGIKKRIFEQVGEWGLKMPEVVFIEELLKFPSRSFGLPYILP